MTTYLDERKVSYKDITVPNSMDMSQCAMHSKIWIAHLLFCVGARSNNEQFNRLLFSTRTINGGSLTNWYNQSQKFNWDYDPFRNIEQIESFINSNIGTNKFIHINTNYRFPPTNCYNIVIVITLENYTVICNKYSLLAKGLKVGECYMFYNNEFKKRHMNYSFYNKQISNNNICNGCKMFCDKEKEKRRKKAHQQYIQNELYKFNQITNKVVCKYNNTGCRQCTSNKCFDHDSKNKISFKVLHSYDSEWKKDSSSKQCLICSTQFTFFKRKHHCRICGNVVCDKCTFFTSNKGRNIVKQIGSFDMVKVRLCMSCKHSSIQYCSGANDKETKKWIYDGK